MSGPAFMIDRPLIGRSLTSGNPMKFPGDSHLLTVAMTGSGKGRCVILPNLIAYSGSVICVDPKGENAALTSRWRAEALGQAVHVFDPFHVVPDADLPRQPSSVIAVDASGNADGTAPGVYRASFNPIDVIRGSSSPEATAIQIATSLIIPSEKDPHWGEGAQNVFAAFMLYVAFDPAFEVATDLRTMETVWRCAFVPKYQRDALAAMLSSDDEFVSAQAAAIAPGGSGDSSKEIASIMNTARVQCSKTFGDPKIMATLRSGSVNFGLLSRVPSTIYIVLPGKLGTVHSRWMRLLLDCALGQIEDAGLAAPPGSGSARLSTLFIMDEFATLGPMRTITEAMGRMRGYGLKFWPFVQNLGQLKRLYSDEWESIVGNAGVVQAFGGVTDVFTCEYLSKLTGEYTEVGKSQSTSTNPLQGVGDTVNTFGRPMLFPGDVRNKLGIDPKARTGQQLLIVGGKGPARAGMMWRDQDFPEYSAFMARLDAAKRQAAE